MNPVQMPSRIQLGRWAGNLLIAVTAIVTAALVGVALIAAMFAFGAAGRLLMHWADYVAK
jgi:hypothetical protein